MNVIVVEPSGSQRCFVCSLSWLSLQARFYITYGCCFWPRLPLRVGARSWTPRGSLFRSWRRRPARSPHGVEDGSVLHDAEQLVGGGHVVSDRPLAVPEEGVRRPDLADHQVVEPQDLDGALELQPLVDPRLTEEDVHGVFLEAGRSGGGIYSLPQIPPIPLLLFPRRERQMGVWTMFFVGAARWQRSPLRISIYIRVSISGLFYYCYQYWDKLNVHIQIFYNQDISHLFIFKRVHIRV